MTLVVMGCRILLTLTLSLMSIWTIFSFQVADGNKKQNKPTGLLGRTAPMAAANLQCWNSEQLRND